MDKKKILVIDDEQNLCSLMEDMLSDDYQVFTATEGQKGIDCAKQEKPHLIFLDMVMPDMVGQEVAKRLAQDPEARNIPVVVMTAKLYEDDPVKAIKKEPNVKGLLNKPCNLGVLTKKIQEVIGA